LPQGCECKPAEGRFQHKGGGDFRLPEIDANSRFAMRVVKMTHEDFVILIFFLIAVLMGGIMLVGVLLLMRRNPKKKE
jgi:hypothetical protein